MADWDLFRSTLFGGINESDINVMAAGIDRALALAANRSIGKCRAKSTMGKNIWWSPELLTLR